MTGQNEMKQIKLYQGKLNLITGKRFIRQGNGNTGPEVMNSNLT